jgi:4-diphosphocytidyl-2-C-methyl-D-erythritol kinase
MICFPNAKINLGLNVVRKRPDGYHDIETVFYPIPIRDALEVTPAEEFSFEQSGIQVDSPVEKNLVVKALRLIEKHIGKTIEVETHLLKTIPFGAGLGGGSADAAFMLKLLNGYLNLSLSDKALEEMSASIGADCPFFIKNKPVFATGIGNIFEPVEVSLKGMFMVLVKPDIAVPTPEAYAGITPKQPETRLTDIIKLPVSEWRSVMTNDFESTVFAKHPLIGEIKDKLYDIGAAYASMSGSGSSVFGIFENEVELGNLFSDYYVWKGTLD